MKEPGFEHGGFDCRAWSHYATGRRPTMNHLHGLGREHRQGRWPGTEGWGWWSTGGGRTTELQLQLSCGITDSLFLYLLIFWKDAKNLHLYVKSPHFKFWFKWSFKTCAIPTNHHLGSPCCDLCASFSSIAPRRGPAQGWVHSAAGTLGSNHHTSRTLLLLPDDRPFSILGQGWGGTPHKFVSVLCDIFPWFEEGKFQVFPIPSQNSLHATILLLVMTPPVPDINYTGVFPIHECWR